MIKSIEHRDGIYKQLVQTIAGSDEYNILKTNLTTFNRIINISKRALKKSYYANKFLEHKSNIKRTWQLINEVVGKNSSKSISDRFLVNNTTITEPIDIANHFNTFFASIGHTLSLNIKQHDDINFEHYLKDRSTSNFEFLHTNSDDIVSIIGKLPAKKSTGHDGISTELLKTLCDIISPTISVIINKCFESGIYPEEMKLSKAKPLYKKGDPTLLNNYRPISLLPSISKVFERVMINQIYNYFCTNSLLTPSQHGFRKNHSTELAAVELIDRVTRLLENNETPFNIYIDLSKAFDTLNHNILLSKLKFYGLSNKALILIESYLTNRKQFCEYNYEKSSILSITTGVPQGSTLGPLFFSIYINDMINCSDKFQFLMYADDTTLCSTIEKFDDNLHDTDYTNENISREVTKLTTWLEVNKLSINETKTKVMIFYMPPKQVTLPIITLNDTQLEIVDTFNFLGININKSLKWKPHVDIMCNKVLKYIAVI